MKLMTTSLKLESLILAVKFSPLKFILRVLETLNAVN